MKDYMKDLTDLRWYGVDLDGCLAENMWPDPNIGPAIERNIYKLMEVHSAGFKIVIHTSRPWSDYAKIEGWLNDRSIPYKAIICGKGLFHRYVDDRAINSEEKSWL